MRTMDIDKVTYSDKGVWIYTPGSELRYGRHKTAYRQHRKLVVIGPNCQHLIKPYFQHDLKAYIFGPKIAENERNATCKTPRRPNQKPTPTNSSKSVGDKYKTGTYARVISDLCKNNDIPHWTPRQIRHTAATEVRASDGLESAQALLDHAQLNMTEHYAKQKLDRAIELARKFG